MQLHCRTIFGNEVCFLEHLIVDVVNLDQIPSLLTSKELCIFNIVINLMQTQTVLVP